MNRDKALTIADRIMTRIETDKAIHKDAIADEIQAGDALDEIVDIITVDGGKMTHRDGTPFNRDADKHPDYVEHVRKSQAESVTEVASGPIKLPKARTFHGPDGGPFVSDLVYRDGRCYQFTGVSWVHIPALDLDDRDTP